MEITLFQDIDLKDVKHVFIDLDNTLYNYDESHHKALIFCYQEFIKLGHIIDFNSFKGRYTECRSEVTTRLMPQGVCRSRLLAFLSLFETMNLTKPFVLAEQFDEFYWGHFYQTMQMSASAFLFLQRCKEKSIAICIVTDMITNIQIRKIKSLGINELIDNIVTSEECGAEKPHPAMFNRALLKMNADLSNSIFIGDDLNKDIDGSRNIGLKNYLVRCDD